MSPSYCLYRKTNIDIYLKKIEKIFLTKYFESQFLSICLLFEDNIINFSLRCTLNIFYKIEN